MQDVRGFDGLDSVFCILTTYQEWRILWLPDADRSANSTIFPDTPEVAPKKREMLSQLLQGSLPPWPGFGATGTSLDATGVSPSKDLNAHRISQGTSNQPEQVPPSNSA